MPHIPDTAHPSHDAELVAAYAAGDLAAGDLERAMQLVAGCPECAALHHDLRLIAAALPALPAPVRPRDFRLSPEQAASLRPRGLRGALAAFASPRFSFAAPLGTGLAALGLVGIIVAGGGIPAGSGGGTAGSATQPYANPAPSAAANPAASAAAGAPAAEGPTDASRVAVEVDGAPSPLPAASTSAGGRLGGVVSDGSVPPAASPAPVAAVPASPGPYDVYGGAAAASPEAQAVTGARDLGAPEATAADTTGGSVPLALATLTMLAGIGLLTLRVVARRMAGENALRSGGG